MGFSPSQVNDMSVWQYMVALDGYVKANSTEDESALGAKEADDIWKWLQEKD